MVDTRNRWDVRIQFEEGEHQGFATASSRERAFRLVLTDAYMAHPCGTFHSPVKTWDATLAEEVAA